MSTAVVERVAQKQALEAKEKIIGEALPTFAKYRDVIGKALMEIRDEQLYLATHRSFREYVEARWEFSIRNAQLLIAEHRPDEYKLHMQERDETRNNLRVPDTDGSNSPDDTAENKPELTWTPSNHNPDQPASKPSANGKPVFDDKQIDDLFGKLARLIDERAKVKGHKPLHERLHDSLKPALAAWKQLRKETAT